MTPRLAEIIARMVEAKLADTAGARRDRGMVRGRVRRSAAGSARVSRPVPPPMEVPNGDDDRG